MKRYLIPILVILVLALPLGGCQTTGTTETQVDMPTLGNDEVCALVYNYLQNKATAMTTRLYREHLLGVLDKARPYFVANYKGNGKWQVSALGRGVKDEDWFFYYSGGLWNLYEASRTIEPANDQATKLLSYIQRWTIPQATTQQKPASQPSTPQQSSQRQYYLQQAEYYQESANSDLNMANMALDSANFHLRMNQTGSMQDLWMRLYQSDMENYQRYMKQYASDQQMANEYLIKAQREP